MKHRNYGNNTKTAEIIQRLEFNFQNEPTMKTDNFWTPFCEVEIESQKTENY